MINTNFKTLNIGGLSINLPIIQGGMGVGISLSGLASAVANEGGVGVIAAASIGMFEPNFTSDFVKSNIVALRKEIRKARQMTKGVLGVNIMVALTNFADMVKTAIDEGIDIIFSGAGLPLNLPQFLKKTDRTKLVPIVSSPRAAGILIKRWVEKFDYVPDAIVVEGPLAGGHLGFNEQQLQNTDYNLENIIPKVVEEIKKYEEKYQKPVPVIAAGGIYSGADIRKFIKLGASGVQMATRFVTTDECDASIEFKKAYLNSKKEDLVIIKSPVGMLGRAIKNSFIGDVAKGKKKPFKCPFHCIKTCNYQKSPYCIALALINAQRGNLRRGFAFSGANAYRAKEIIPVKKLIETLTQEYQLCN